MVCLVSNLISIIILLMVISRKVSLWCLVALILLSFGLYVISRNSFPNLLRVSFLDIGQGDAIFIEAPNGSQFIIDGGPDNNLLKELGKVMPFFDHTIDGIMVTNDDSDHYSGFIGMLDRYSTAIEFESGTKKESTLFDLYKDKLSKHGVKQLLAKRGMRIVLDKESKVYLDIIFPDRDVYNLATNDGSIVAKLVYGDTSIMLQGDSPSKIEHYLVGQGVNLKADILKLGHHGSRTSTSEEYVREVDPRYAVAMLGASNHYGFPHKETLSTLNNLSIPFLRTDLMGTITFISNGTSWKGL